MHQKNYEEKLLAIKKLTSNWLLETLLILEKIVVIKTLALSIIVQTLSILPDSPTFVINDL